MGLSQIDQIYFEAWGKAGGSERVRRAFSMFDFMRQMLTLQVKKRMPALSPRAYIADCKENLLLGHGSAAFT